MWGGDQEKGFLCLPHEGEVFAAAFPSRAAEFWDGIVCQVGIALDLDLVSVSFLLDRNFLLCLKRKNP